MAAGFLLLAPAGLVAAKTLYVSDELVITFREGKGTQYRIIRTLKTGTPVEILEEDKDYLKVRIASGEVGYVLKQYLTDETPKSETIAAQRKEIDQLRAQLGSVDSGRTEITTQLEQSRENQRQLSAQLEQATKDLQSLQGKHEDLVNNSANVVALSDERDRLSNENTQLAVELAALRSENRTLLRTAMIQWFLAGGGVFFIGWMSGKFSRKKRRNGFS